MPWETETVEMQRDEFVREAISREESFSALCRRYGITRRTGYKWMERFEDGERLCDRSHTPQIKPRKTPEHMERLILDTRTEHPTWGGRKLHRYLEDRGVDGLPAPSTITSILRRGGRISPEESAAHTPYTRFERERPNELWQMDFKGHYALLDGRRCHPLTISDDHSRMLLCLDAKANERWDGVKASLERVFGASGLPEAILSDNGPPWGDSHQGYTLFELWMMQMDVLPIHGRPLHPQTQGKEERFHRTLNEDLIKRVPMRDLAHAQEEFDRYLRLYDYERPHNALGLDVPAQHYRPSGRVMPQSLSEPEYDSGAQLRKVNYKGYVSIYNKRYYLSETFIGKYLRCDYDCDDGVRLLYGGFQIAKIDLREQLFISRRIFRDA